MTVQKKLIELGKELFDLKAEKEELEEKLKEINKRKEVLEVHEIPNLMQDTEITKFTIDGYGTIYKKNDVRAYIRVDNQEEAFDWLNENGHGDIIKETVHWATLRKWANEMLEENKEIPGFIEVTPITVAMTRRS